MWYGAEVGQDVAATGAAALVWICVAVSDLRRLLEGNLDARRRPLGTVSQRQAVIGVRIEKGPQPLDHRQLFFLQVRHHFGDEVGRGTLELRPAVGIDTILEDPGGDPTHPPRQRADDHVLLGQERRQFAAASRADEREQNRFFEGVVVDDLVERDDEFLEMLLLVLVSRVDRSPSLGADNTVLEATNQRENAEMFFVEHLSQFCQKRHRRTTALHAMQYEFAALQQCNRSPIATLGKRHHQSMKTAYATIKGFEVMRMFKEGYSRQATAKTTWQIICSPRRIVRWRRTATAGAAQTLGMSGVIRTGITWSHKPIILPLAITDSGAQKRAQLACPRLQLSGIDRALDQAFAFIVIFMYRRIVPHGWKLAGLFFVLLI